MNATGPDREVRGDSRAVGGGLIFLLILLLFGSGFMVGLVEGPKGIAGDVGPILLATAAAAVLAFLVARLSYRGITAVPAGEQRGEVLRAIVGFIGFAVSVIVGFVAFFVIAWLTCLSYSAGTDVRP